MSVSEKTRKIQQQRCGSSHRLVRNQFP